MFTGIIQAIGRVAGTEPRGGDLRLRIHTGELDLSTTALGDSIATNGVCLTVVELPGDGFFADVSRESLAHTTLGRLRPGDRVNLERALTLATPLGGHLVSGHVDGVGEVVARRQAARSVCFTLRAPAGLARYIALKGSICVDGVSLTVNGLDGELFELNIVPHTLERTLMEGYREGRQVNLEVDLVARYLERLLLGDEAARPGGGSPTGVTLELLAQRGFLQR